MANQVANIIEGNWDQLKGKAKKYWGKVNNDDWSMVEGSYDTLVGKLTENYGWTKNEAELQVNTFIEQIGKYKEQLTAEDGVLQDMFETLSNSVEKCHTRLNEIEGAIAGYVKRNPVQVISVALIAGFAFAKLCNIKN